MPAIRRKAPQSTKHTLLTAARLKRGASLLEMAKNIGCDKGNLSRIERGETKPSLELAKRIADFFGEQVITRDQILFPELYPVPHKKPSRSVRTTEVV